MEGSIKGSAQWEGEGKTQALSLRGYKGAGTTLHAPRLGTQHPLEELEPQMNPSLSHAAAVASCNAAAPCVALNLS